MGTRRVYVVFLVLFICFFLWNERIGIDDGKMRLSGVSRTCVDNYAKFMVRDDFILRYLYARPYYEHFVQKGYVLFYENIGNSILGNFQFDNERTLYVLDLTKTPYDVRYVGKDELPFGWDVGFPSFVLIDDGIIAYKGSSSGFAQAFTDTGFLDKIRQDYLASIGYQEGIDLHMKCQTHFHRGDDWCGYVYEYADLKGRYAGWLLLDFTKPIGSCIISDFETDDEFFDYSLISDSDSIDEDGNQLMLYFMSDDGDSSHVRAEFMGYDEYDEMFYATPVHKSFIKYARSFGWKEE